MEKEMATHSNILAWRIPWTEEAGVHGVIKNQTWLGDLTHTGYKFQLKKQSSRGYVGTGGEAGVRRSEAQIKSLSEQRIPLSVNPENPCES